MDVRLRNDILSEINIVGDILHVSPSISNVDAHSTEFDVKMKTHQLSLLGKLLEVASLHRFEPDKAKGYLRTASSANCESDLL